MTNLSQNASLILDDIAHEMRITVLPVTIFIGLEAIFGLVGNTLIIVIYSKSYHKNNFRYFVLSMATIDFTSCFTTLPGEMYFQINWYRYAPSWICKIKSYFNVWTALSSAFILLLLAFDRHRKICFPLGRQLQPSLAMKLSVLSFALATIMSAPTLLLWGHQSYLYKHESGTEIRVSICEKSSQFAHGIYPFIYIGCVYILPIGTILILLCALNLMTARYLLCRTFVCRQRRSPSRSQSSLRSSPGYEQPIHNRHSSELSGVENTDALLANSLKTGSNFDCQCVHEFHIILSDFNTAHGLRNHRSNSDPLGDRRCNGHEKATCTTHKYCAHSSRRHNDHTASRSCRGSDSNIVNHSSTCSHCRVSRTSTPSRRRRHFIKPSTRSVLSSRSSVNSARSTASSLHSDAHHQNNNREIRGYRPKTIIMFILTMVYVVTMSIYIVLTTVVAWHDGIFQHLKDSQKSIFFFFWRFYFINCVINPILYGLLDPRFRKGLNGLFTNR